MWCAGRAGAAAGGGSAGPGAGGAGVQQQQQRAQQRTSGFWQRAGSARALLPEGMSMSIFLTHHIYHRGIKLIIQTTDGRSLKASLSHVKLKPNHRPPTTE
jgi:hypothetical protein